MDSGTGPQPPEDHIDNMIGTSQPQTGNESPTTVLPSSRPTVMGGIASKAKHKRRFALLALILVIVLGASVLSWWLGHYHSSKPTMAATSSQHQSTSVQRPASTATANVQGLQLDNSKNYGNKYADGLLPVGDGKYTTAAAKQGTVYACSQYAQNLGTDSGGAMTRGPWFTNNNTAYDINKKVAVGGSVTWHGSLTDTVSGSTRTIVTNDLPLTDPTGIFPIRSTDPAYQYDRNPNTITSQSLTYSLPADPTYNASPNCESGTVGIMLTGVQLFNAFDAGGRDAGAWEVQDDCSGHPQEKGAYHYHTLSSCIKDTTVHTVIGYALDGFPITGPTVGPGNILTTADLDECHGIVSLIDLDGKNVTRYHYVMTQDFPYSIGCFRGTPTTPPGQSQSQGGQQQTPSGGQGQAPPARNLPPPHPY
jgi:YHYH protein